jgi:hypothetical protein
LSAKDLKRLQDLWARIIDPASASEETSTARTKLNELLNKNGLTRHDLPKVMAKIEMQRMAAEEAAAAATRAAGWKKEPDANDLGIPGNNLLGLMLTLIEEYIWVTAEERLAIALWILHTIHVPPIPSHAATSGHQSDRRLWKDDGAEGDRAIGSRTGTVRQRDRRNDLPSA